MPIVFAPSCFLWLDCDAHCVGSCECLSQSACCWVHRLQLLARWITASCNVVMMIIKWRNHLLTLWEVSMLLKAKSLTEHDKWPWISKTRQKIAEKEKPRRPTYVQAICLVFFPGPICELSTYVSISKTTHCMYKTGMAAYICSPSTWDSETRGLPRIWGKPLLSTTSRAT